MCIAIQVKISKISQCAAGTGNRGIHNSYGYLYEGHTRNKNVLQNSREKTIFIKNYVIDPETINSDFINFIRIYPASMKKIILLVVFQFACLLANAQNHEIDSVRRFLHFTSDISTDRLTATIKDTIFGKTAEGSPFAMVARYSTKDSFFAISFLCKDAGCVANRALIDYIFADGKKNTVWNYESDNCDGYFMVLYKSWTGIDPREISVFSTKLLNIVRFNGSKTIEVALAKNQSYLFRSEMKWLKYYSENWKKVDKLNGY